VRDALHDGNAEGFDALGPRSRGGRPPTRSCSPFSTWSLYKLEDNLLVAQGWSTTPSTRGWSTLLDEAGVSFQRLKASKQSRDPHHDKRLPGVGRPLGQVTRQLTSTAVQRRSARTWVYHRPWWRR
jgi:hypothetical protein